MHTNENLRKCDVCKKNFITNQGLRNHLLLHNGKIVFVKPLVFLKTNKCLPNKNFKIKMNEISSVIFARKHLKQKATYMSIG